MTNQNETTAAPRRGLLTPSQAAEYLGVPTETLRHWRNARTGPTYVRVGRHVRYTLGHLDAWVASQLVDPQTGKRVDPSKVA